MPKQSKIAAYRTFKDLLKRNGYNDEVINKLWKWHDPSERRGVASYQLCSYACNYLIVVKSNVVALKELTLQVELIPSLLKRRKQDNISQGSPCLQTKYLPLSGQYEKILEYKMVFYFTKYSNSRYSSGYVLYPCSIGLTLLKY